MHRDPAGSVEIMVARDNDIAFVSQQRKTFMCIPGFQVCVIGNAETGNIPQADQQIIPSFFNSGDDLPEVPDILMYI
jgi:hypothetical protein